MTLIKNYYNVPKTGLSNDTIRYNFKGEVNGKAGTFEISTRPAVNGSTEVVMHRFFNPD